jgi:hypothetical protein
MAEIKAVFDSVDVIAETDERDSLELVSWGADGNAQFSVRMTVAEARRLAQEIIDEADRKEADDARG